MGKLSGLLSTATGFTLEAASALSHPSANPTSTSDSHSSPYGYYTRTQNLPLYQQPNSYLPQTPQCLPLPVIIPQRRPQNKSRGWARAYAPALMGTGIDRETFLGFVDGFNEECKASPYLHVVNVAGAGVGFLPGITPMLVSMAVPVAVQAAKKAQSKHQSDSYLDKMNKALFIPHGLYAIVMTYNPAQSSDTVGVDMSSNGSQSQPQSPYRTTSSYSNGADGGQKPSFRLPDSCPLIFADPAPPQTLDPNRNGFFKMADFVSDFKDRRAQASFAQENPTSTLIGPKPTFTNKYADPSYTSSGRAAPRRQPQQEEENKKPGMLKGMKEKVMHSDVLYLMIVNNTGEVNGSSPDSVENVSRRGGSYQYGPAQNYESQRQKQYQVSSPEPISSRPASIERRVQRGSSSQHGPTQSYASQPQAYSCEEQNEENVDRKQEYQSREDGESRKSGYLGQQWQGTYERQYATPPLPPRTAPPQYTPYPRDE